jgi:ATP-dependent helicase HrpA
LGEVPEKVSEGCGAHLVEAWPGLKLEEGHVSLRLFRSAEAARRASLAGVRHLVEIALQKDLAWLQKDLRGLATLGPVLPGLCTLEELQAGAYSNVKSYLLPAEPLSALTEKHFSAAVEAARSRLPSLASQISDRIEVILKFRQEILRRVPAPTPSAGTPRTLSSLQALNVGPPKPPASTLAERELNALLPRNFLENVPFDRLPDLARYLKALRVRLERASVNPAKDLDRDRLVAPYIEMLRKWKSSTDQSESFRMRLEEFRWMVEEFKISIFAQELGTAIPVSPKRLDEQASKVREAARS